MTRNYKKQDQYISFNERSWKRKSLKQDESDLFYFFLKRDLLHISYKTSEEHLRERCVE